MKDENNVKKGFDTVLRTKDKSSAKDLSVALLYSVCSYLLGCGEAVFGTYPFGIAFMCAVKRHLPFAIVGAMLSSIVNDVPVGISLCGYIASALFRYGASYFLNGRDRFDLFSVSDSVLCRICASGVGALTVSVLRLSLGGFTYYDLFGVFSNVFICIFMVYVYSFAFDSEKRYTQGYEAGICAVFFSLVLSMRSFELFGISTGAVCAFIFPFYTSRKAGVLRGTVFGVLCGAALDITLCPVFGVFGFISGVLSLINVYPCYIVSSSASLLMCLYVYGVQAVVSFLPEAVLAAVIYIPLERLSLLPALFIFKDGVEYKNAVSVERIANSYNILSYDRELLSLATSLESVSEVMRALSEKEKRPAVHEICSLCEKEFSSFCKKCSVKKVCFPNGIHGSSHIRECACKIYEKGVLSTSDLPEKVKTGCYFADKLTVNINIKLAEYNSEKLRNNKTEVMAEDLCQFSRFINDISKNRKSNDAINLPLTDKLKKNNLYKDIFGKNVAVYGYDRLSVIACGVDTAKMKALSSEIQRNFGKALGVTLGKCEYTECDGFTAAIFKRKEKYECIASCLQSPKSGEVINGDTTFSFTSNGKFYVCICDGMGSGHTAALTSKLAGIFLQKMLCCEIDTEGILKMLNHFIKNKSGECFTTVDILCVDLLNGNGSFTKSGAAPSYVIRDGRIFRMSSLTPPLGIMSELCAERIDFTFRNGDIAVMASDGVADSSDELVWLYNLLTYESDCDTKELCDRIMSRSASEHLKDDDMTVCAVSVVLSDKT